MAAALVNGPVGCVPKIFGSAPGRRPDCKTGLNGLAGNGGLNAGLIGGFENGDGGLGGLPDFGCGGKPDFGLGTDSVGGLRTFMVFPSSIDKKVVQVFVVVTR